MIKIEKILLTIPTKWYIYREKEGVHINYTDDVYKEIVFSFFKDTNEIVLSFIFYRSKTL